MKFHQLAESFYTWGWKIKHEHYVAFSDYLKEMLKRNRVMVIMDGAVVTAIILYFLTDDYTRVYKKGTWDLPKSDDPAGNQIYVDKLLCKKWTPEIRRLVQNAIQEKYPHVTEGFYHRSPNDRCVRITKREILCTR